MFINMFMDLSLKYKIVCIFVLAVIILTVISILRRQLVEEGFIAQQNPIEELDNKRTMWPTSDQTGLRPIIIRNKSSFPSITLIHMNQVQYGKTDILEPVLEIMRARIYPFNISTGIDIKRCLDMLLAPVLGGGEAPIRFAILRENAVIESHRILNKYKDKYNNKSSIKKPQRALNVWCPMYHEIFLALGNEQGFIKNMQQLRDIRPDGRLFRVAVPVGDMAYFQLACRNLNVPWKTNTRKFELVLIDGKNTDNNNNNSDVNDVDEVDDVDDVDDVDKDRSRVRYRGLEDALSAMSKMSLDMIFVICHPKNSSIQQHVINSPTRLIDIFPPSAIPENADQFNPYEAGETNLIHKFSRDMHRDIPWLFVENMDRTRIPLVSYESSKQGNSIENERPEPAIYNTFRIRTLLVSSWNSNDRVRREYLETVTDIAERIIKYYNTFERTVLEWNSDASAIQDGNGSIMPTIANNNPSISKSAARENMVSRIKAYNSFDGDSFEFDAIGAISKELELELAFKNVLIKHGLMKNEIIYSCKL